MKRSQRDSTRTIRSWLEEGVTVLPDRVLDSVQDSLHRTPQRRGAWFTRLLPKRGATRLRFGIAAVAVVAMAVVGGVSVLPRNVGGPPTPTATPAPETVTLASGTFAAQFGAVDIEATARSATRLGQPVGTWIVAGALEVANDGGRFRVDLQCTRTDPDEQVWIGGDIVESTHEEAVVGQRVAIVFQPGSPVESVLWFEAEERQPSCDGFLDGAPAVGDFLEPIQGQVDLGTAPRVLPLGEADLDEGWYTLEGFPVRITFDVPAGYTTSCSHSALEQSICTAPRDPALGFLLVENVVEEPCSESLRDPAPESLDDLVTAISSLDGFEATPAVDVSIDGFAGKRFVITAPDGIGCDLRTWSTAQRTNGVGRGEVNELTILEIDGAFVMFAIAHFPNDPPREGLAALRQVVDSLQIGR